MFHFIKLLFLLFFGLAITGCSASPALHVIGVYEGQTSPGVAGRPSADFHKRHTDKHPERAVVVRISDTSRPLVLAFTAYEKTLWKVDLKDGVKLVKVVLAGYHSQRISGISDSIPIEIYSYDPSPCEHCWQSSEYFYSYKAPPKQLKGITGLDVTSFQGRYKGSEFSIFQGMKEVNE